MPPTGDAVDSIPPETIEVAGPSDATAVVFVHGAGISRHMWQPQFRDLSGEFRTVTFDLPGHGTLADGRFEFDAAVGRLADVVADLDGDVVLVGHSLGGYVVAEYAARTPDGIAGILLSGSSADYRGLLGVRTELTSALYRLGGRLPFVDRWFRERTASQVRSLPVSEDVADGIVDGGFYLRSWGEAGSALVGRDFEDRLRGFEGPILLVNGEDDTLNVPNAERLAADRPNVESVVLAGVGHLCNLQAPGAYTNCVREFARKCRLDSGAQAGA